LHYGQAVLQSIDFVGLLVRNYCLFVFTPPQFFWRRISNLMEVWKFSCQLLCITVIPHWKDLIITHRLS